MKRLLLLSCSLALLLSGSLAAAQSLSEYEAKQRQIEELEAKVTTLQVQVQTLANQIAFYDSRITLTTLKISQTEDQIASISAKIEVLETRLQERSRLLENQIVRAYKNGVVDPLQVLFSSANFAQILARFKYLQIVQSYSLRLLHQTQLVQANYGQQKALIEQSQQKLQSQKNALAALRADRDNLLKQTKNSEATYQKQLEQARLELEAIQKALATAIQEGPVRGGDTIAFVGNSGYPDCSTGKHLHFEVRQGDTWVNAENYLVSRQVRDDTANSTVQVGAGSWRWPLNGEIRVTQRYGKTPYSYRYRGSDGVHTGIDMLASDEVVAAVADGTLYSSTQRCGASDLKLKYIDHGNGLKTFYLHVQ